MVCDVFYNHNPPFEGDGDRCSRNEIAAGTAAQFTILGVSTTFCGASRVCRLDCLPAQLLQLPNQLIEPG